MAEIVNNEKKFKVIKCSVLETILKLDGAGICDMCNCHPPNGYYIAVLNYWICGQCFEDWLKTAKNYPEDRESEKRNFDYYSKILDVNSK